MSFQPMVKNASPAKLEHAKRRTLRKVITVAVVMFGFGFAMVPFYKKFCQATGANNIDQPDVTKALSSVDMTRTIVVQFDANQRDGWIFHALSVQKKMHPGELVKVEYTATNLTNHVVKAQAIPSYGPLNAQRYFHKLQCFCFSQQIFGPHEKKRLPVIFRVDPSLPKDLKFLTLSYTLFRVEGV